MESFLNEIVEGEKFELLIDARIFPIDLVLKASYNFLDRGYFFFKLDENNNIILQFSKKEGIATPPKEVIGIFTEGLLEVYLRNKLEVDNKTIREAIVTKALNGPIDANNFVTLDTQMESGQTVADFDKDIDQILKEIESDPELKIDEAEIEKILKEIEMEAPKEAEKPKITLDTNAIEDAKKKFQN